MERRIRSLRRRSHTGARRPLVTIGAVRLELHFLLKVLPDCRFNPECGYRIFSVSLDTYQKPNSSEILLELLPYLNWELMKGVFERNARAFL